MSAASLAVQSAPSPAPVSGKQGSGKGKAAKTNDTNAFGALMGAADAGRKGAQTRGQVVEKAGPQAAAPQTWQGRKPAAGADAEEAADAAPAGAARDEKPAEPEDALALLMSAVTPPSQIPAADAPAAMDATAGAPTADARVADETAVPAAAAAESAKPRAGLASLLADRRSQQAERDTPPPGASAAQVAVRAAAPADTVARDAAVAASAGPAADAGTASSAPEAPRETAARAAAATGRDEAGTDGRREAHAAAGPSGAQPEPKVTVSSVQVAPAPAAPVAAPSPTGAALVASLDGDGTLTRYVSETQALPASDARPVTTLKLQLHPAELGNVAVKISGTGEEIAIEIQVESSEARHRLTSDSDAIVKSLRGLGYEVDRITVQQVAPPANAGQQQSTAGGRGDGFAAFGERGGERQERQQGQTNTGGREHGEHRSSQPQADRGSASGAVYI